MQRAEELIERLAQAAKMGPFFERAMRKQLEDMEKLRTKDQEEEETADLAALLKPERERVQALAPKGEGGDGSDEGGGIMGAAVQQLRAQAAIAERAGDASATAKVKELEERLQAELCVKACSLP